jgi:hypothetical protein
MWTPITGTASYSNGKTISFAAWKIVPTYAKDPFKNTLGTQDYTTYYQGGNGKSITPGTGLKNVAAPTPGTSE